MEPLNGEPVATPNAAPEPQGEPTPTPTGGEPTFDAAKHFQSIAEQRQAEIYRLQQEQERMRSEMLTLMQRVSAPTQQNPHDYTTNFPEWNRWENQRLAEQIAEKAREASRQEFAGLIQRASEMQWSQAHPEVDIAAVKAFAQQRGIQRLEDAYTVMKSQETLQTAFSTASAAALRQFQQPQSGASPIRGAEAAPVQSKVSFKETLEAWSRNPAIEDTWSPEFKADFERELRAHQKLQQMVLAP